MTSITLENKQNGRLQKAFSLLSDIVKVKEGAIPDFSHSDSTKSHAEHQNARWIYQTALMRGDWQMRKEDSNNRIANNPGQEKSLHNAPHVIIKENGKFPKAKKATTRNENQDETMEEVPSQAQSRDSSQVSFQIPPQVSSRIPPQVSSQDSYQDSLRASSQVSFHSQIPNQILSQVSHQNASQIPCQNAFQVPNQDSVQSFPRDANYRVQASSSSSRRVNTFAIEENSETFNRASHFCTSGNSFIAEEEIIDTGSNSAPLYPHASQRMIQFGSSSLDVEDEEVVAATAAAEILASFRLTASHGNKRCAKTKSSSNKQNTNSNNTANLPSNQDKNLKSSFSKVKQIPDGATSVNTSSKPTTNNTQRWKSNNKQKDASKNPPVEINSSKSTETHQTRKQSDSQETATKGKSWQNAIDVDNFVAKGSCWQKAIDVDEINEIELTEEVRQSPKNRSFALKGKDVRVKKEVKQEK
ncbi:uncharacterized protein FA14DRAFT_78409 [Meira miltonrushii]|uniref:Uncharacterized protein n=1 Tax=Meira miltonrushii TaxID=1280837 RepID=A0A316V5H6_9BASI|nr:uncharacterized protein FA14DRAFT_78409 [Meira miltonrushii]PWN32827.1 hypothetical protein FA14DRAFT_78409 [Meira miltonrushii]